ncbi:hypothetical protein BH23CHL4_BH23CHL4_29380 [soil metagenome]
MAEMGSIPGGQTGAPAFEALEDHRASLERRLYEGYVRIEEALEAGQDVTSWERFWIELLHQYEVVCTQLQQAA